MGQYTMESQAHPAPGDFDVPQNGQQEALASTAPSGDLDALQLNVVAALGGGPRPQATQSRSSSATSGQQPGAAQGHHPNIFVRGLPLAWSEAEITAVFEQYGSLTTLRLVRHSVTKQSLGYGFVRFQDVNEAQAAILALDGTCILGHTLQVKFADADAGPPTSISSSGLTPSDSCYAKHLPASYGIADVQQLFEAYGAVMDVKLFPCLDQFRGASALVRMASTEAAERAIQSLNNSSPPGCAQSLIVRFAESPAEKAARLSRRERQQQMLQRGVLQPSLAAGLGALDPMQIQQALAALSLNGLPLTAAGASMPGNGQAGVPRMPPAVGPAGAGMPPVYQAPVRSSICVKGLPPTADRLWVYENFARFGALVGMRILIDESTGLCNGTVFINFAEAVAAERARQAMNGMRSGEKILNVMVQQQAQLTGMNGTNGTGTIASPPQMLGDGYVPATMPMGVSQQATQAEWQQLLQQQSAAMQQGAMAW